MNKNQSIVDSVGRIYSWIDSETGEQVCDECGKCCDFESFGHKLFVTTPEMLYFTQKMKPVKTMTGGICPYNCKGKCSVYEDRFAGCRIFNCKIDNEAQNKLTEDVLEELKTLCDGFGFPYRYLDLKTALNNCEEMINS